jgi:hypothetical protein
LAWSFCVLIDVWIEAKSDILRPATENETWIRFWVRNSSRKRYFSFLLQPEFLEVESILYPMIRDHTLFVF